MLRVVLYEGDGARPLEANERFGAITALLERGFAVTRAGNGGRLVPTDRNSLLVLGKFNEGKPPLAEDAAGQVAVRLPDLTRFHPPRLADHLASTCAQLSA